MADNVDISLKLGTEADISSAINAGARAGAAFAAAAQSAVSSLSISTRGFEGQGAATADIASNIRKLRRAGFSKAKIQALAGSIIESESSNATNTWGFRTGAYPVVGQQPAQRSLLDKVTTQKGSSALSGYSISPFMADKDFLKTYIKMEGAVARISNNIQKVTVSDGIKVKPTSGGTSFNKVLGYAKLVETYLKPLGEYIGEAGSEFLGVTGRATYRAQTARSTQGFRQEQLEKDVALWNMLGTYGSKTGLLGGAAIGAAIGSFVPLVGTAFGAVIGGVTSVVAEQLGKSQIEKKTQELNQQYKSLNEAQKRYYANTLFGGNYNVSFARATAELGIGATEEQIMSNSTNALTFRGDLARGKISAGQMQALAFMPNTLANYINGETDPETLMAGYRADLEPLGDESLAASIANDAIGLGTWVTARSGAYGQMANRWNSDTLGTTNAYANSVVGGYINRHAQNVVSTQIADMAMFLKNAHDAPESFWGGQAKPTDKENDWATAIFNYARTTAMQGALSPATPIVVNLVVDGDTIKSVDIGEAIKERTSFLNGGQSFIAGGY